MKVENPQAFRFIMPDEIYLLDQDKGDKTTTLAENPVLTQPAPEPVLAPETEIEQVIPPPPAAAQPVVVQTPGSAFNYLGNNNKRFLILTSYHNEQFIAPAHQAALENILKRKELDLNDVVILNTHTYPEATIKQLYGHFKPDKILILGANAIPEGLTKPTLNQPVRTSTIAILYSYSFDEMMDSNENKKVFWEQMKTL
ncbi:hypothetical protein [Mucilaginibacter glaciei]|uniref:Uncharacterized protein n=1 Tax=Mucilaginibacter glaciei TaxID=2772109 RepID=A0A926S2E2_9SPHI|nr:hypothetical protein [Mucilaginibacter glaciei]MBD1394043.1 hypothetical protein [Mucilaginibacter glaciei]